MRTRGRPTRIAPYLDATTQRERLGPQSVAQACWPRIRILQAVAAAWMR
jgi:hypothetical protein